MKAVKVRGRVFSYSRTIGNVSVFRYPVDLALGEGNTIYVLNRGHDGDWIFGVNVINTDEGLLGKFGGNGEGDGQFIWPTALVVDSQGLAYVADEWLNRISVYDTTVEFNNQDIGERNFLRKWGTVGSGDGQINGPAGMVLDSDENLYITEYVNHRVSKFTRGGEFLMNFGKEGSGPGEFNRPWGIAVDSQGDLYVADWRNDRVQKFTPDGRYLATFGTPGAGPGKLHLPSDVAVDRDGDVYVTDWGQNKVEVYDAEGGHLATFYGDAEKLSKSGEEYLELNIADNEKRQKVTNFEPEFRFNLPTAVEVDGEGRILVADNVRMRIQIYRKERG